MSGQDTSKFPVEHVSWDRAIEFCNKLSVQENRTPCYGSIELGSVELLNGNGYRLPTEAEWEYACRAGTTTPFHFGTTNNGREANVNGNLPYGTTTKGPSLWSTTNVGSYQPNAFGLYDMHGNVWEWCCDISDDHRGTTVGPGKSMRSGPHVMRGGSWSVGAKYARSAYRLKDIPVNRGSNYGFRVVCSPLP